MDIRVIHVAFAMSASRLLCPENQTLIDVTDLRVTSRLQSPASASVQGNALDFTAVQFATARETAYSRARRHIAAYPSALGEQRNFPFSKVGGAFMARYM